MSAKSSRSTKNLQGLAKILANFSHSDLIQAGKIIETTIREREREASANFPHNTVVGFIHPRTLQPTLGYIKWRNERTSNIIDINGEWHKINWCDLSLAVHQ